MNYRMFFILSLTLFSDSFIASMERDEEKQIDCARTFLGSNLFSSHAQPNEVPNLHKTMRKMSDVASYGDVKKYKNLSDLFLRQLGICRYHIGNNVTYLQGIQELQDNCTKALKYINEIESNLSPEQFKLNVQLIAAIGRAKEHGVKPIVQLLSQGASANGRDVFTGETALTKAIEATIGTTVNVNPFKCILSSPDINPNLELYDIAHSKPGQSPLTTIAYKMKELKEELCEQQETHSPDIIDQFVCQGNIERQITLLKSMISALIEKGADPNKVDGNGETFNQLMPNFFRTKTDDQMPPLVP